jgi:hypothetical protein
MRCLCRGGIIIECLGFILLLCSVMLITFSLNSLQDDMHASSSLVTKVASSEFRQFARNTSVPPPSSIVNKFHVAYLDKNHISGWMNKLIAKADISSVLLSNIKSKERLWKAVSPSLIMENAHALSESRGWQNNTSPPRALLYMGWVSFWNMESFAAQGGPQGEFVMWAGTYV